MQTPFYVSGFLYSLKTHQILLVSQGPKDDHGSAWCTLGGESKDGEEGETTFQRVVQELLDIELQRKNIHPIYDYFHESLDKTNYVFYGEVKNPKVFDTLKTDTFSWLDFSQLVKLSVDRQNKQDIVVGERVINAKWREDEAKKEPSDQL